MYNTPRAATVKVTKKIHLIFQTKKKNSVFEFNKKQNLSFFFYYELKITFFFLNLISISYIQKISQKLNVKYGQLIE